MVRIQTSSETHWCTMCSSGVRARGSGRKPRSASWNCDQTDSVLRRSVEYVSEKKENKWVIVPSMRLAVSSGQTTLEHARRRTVANGKLAPSAPRRCSGGEQSNDRQWDTQLK